MSEPTTTPQGTRNKIRITDIYCPTCGAPARFDIVRQGYLCAYCGGTVEIREANQRARGFRKMQGDRLRKEVHQFHLSSATCGGCGATVFFEENEALSGCAFCGRNLVRQDYLSTENLPENVIPFALTEEEGRERLRAWCEKNRGKEEAKHLLPLLGELKGFYLPYELIRGPVHMRVARMDGGASYPCEGFIENEFVNRSKQLDNLLLDGMEPFNLEGLTEFDFAYVAGHRVKTSDLPDRDLESRVSEEAGVTYTPAVRKVMESQAVYVDADVSSAMRIPVLLPVYYISRGNVMAAVNGQTGKVSVRAEKESHYYFLPWWLKAILATLGTVLAVFAALNFFGMPAAESLIIAGALALVLLIVLLCLYSDTTKNRFAVESGRKIFTSEGKTFHRERGRLVQDDKILERKVSEPVFFQKLDGTVRPVILKFTTPSRVLRMALLCVAALFLPVIIALFLNGFDFGRLELGGSAVWFCIMVPVVPVYLLKFGVVELYERPWIYTVSEDGKKRRYREKRSIDWDMVKLVLRALVVPPACLGVWFAIACFLTMCYLTAFGFGD